LKDKKGGGEGLRIIGITDRAGRVGGAIRPVEIKMVRGRGLTVEHREEDIKDR